MKRILLSIFLLVFIIFPFFAAETFIVDKYDVSIDVDASAMSHVKERLDIDFTSPSHGLFRDLQYDFGIGLKAGIENVRTDVESSYSYENGYMVLRLGSPDRIVQGPVEYNISYDFMIPEVKQRGFERWYYNVLSAAWDTVVRDFTFSVCFPYAVDPSKVHVSVGAYGSEKYIDYTLSSDGRTVSGRLSNLPPYFAVTVLAEFEEGYFDSFVPKMDFSIYGIIGCFILSLLFFLFAIKSYIKYGKDEELVYPVRFCPPEGLSSLDCGYIVDNKVDADSDALSMIFYWADKGFLRIEERGKEEYHFIKLKDLPDDRPPYERNLFDVFFSRGDDVDITDVVKSGFREKLTEKIIPDMERYYELNHPLEDVRSRSRASFLLAMGFILSIAGALLISMKEIGAATFIVLVPQLIVLLALMALYRDMTHESGIGFYFKSAGKIFLTILLLVITFLSSMAAGLILTGSILLAFLSGLSSALIAFSATFLSNATRKRSDYGYSILCEVLGYREFLKEVEVDKLKVLIEEDPDYFYHNLAYAVALGLENDYVKKFKGLTAFMPVWYSGSDLIVDYMFWHMFTTSWRSNYNHIYSSIRPSSRPGGGGFKGGSFGGRGFSGFAGGGFSGGGGRSW